MLEEVIIEDVPQLSRYPRARLVRGRAGDVIGVVTATGDDALLSTGMYVLFSQPPAAPEGEVYLVDYVVRDSKNGRKYVKCFQWATREALVKSLVQMKVREVAELLGIGAEAAAAFVAALLKDSDVAGRLLAAQLPDSIVLGTFDDIVVVVKGEKAVVIPRDITKKCSVLDRVPRRLMPIAVYSEKYGAVVVDDAFESFEADAIVTKLRERGILAFSLEHPSGSAAELTIVLPKDSEVLRRLKALRETKMPTGLKGLVYLEVLGLKAEEVGYNAYK